ncbi:MAG: DctP family TRAP transporter solute-binding subunit [Veillonellales bacterium]
MTGVKKFKKLGILLLMLIFSLTFLAGCGNDKTAGSNQKHVLKVGHPLAADHPWTVCLEGMAKDVKEATNGEVEIQVFPSSQLGSELDVANGLKMGTIEMGLFGTASLNPLDKRMAIEELPYAWPKRENAYAALDGELGEALNKIMEKQGIIGLSWWEAGYRQTTNSKKPINSVEDFRGLKIRVPNNDMRIDTFKLLGAEPTPISFAEVFTALQQGAVDGQENPLITIQSSKLYEVQKYLTLTNHIWGSGYLAISKQAWDELSPEQQKIVKEKAQIWRDKERQMIKDGEAKSVDELKKSGMQVTEPNFQEFKDAEKPVWDKYEAIFGKDLMDLVKKYSSK